MARAKVVILPDGQMSIFIREGSYEEGRQKLQALIKSLGAAGVEFADEGKIEQHRHHGEAIANHNHTEVHNGNH